MTKHKLTVTSDTFLHAVDDIIHSLDGIISEKNQILGIFKQTNKCIIQNGLTLVFENEEDLKEFKIKYCR